jgi:hypothetical protein
LWYRHAADIVQLVTLQVLCCWRLQIWGTMSISTCDVHGAYAAYAITNASLMLHSQRAPEAYMGNVPPLPNKTRTKQSHQYFLSAAPSVPPTFASSASIGMNRNDGGDKTSQQHRPRRNAQPCFNWADTGECFRGAKCWYTHDPTVRRSDSLVCSGLMSRSIGRNFQGAMSPTDSRRAATTASGAR